MAPKKALGGGGKGGGGGGGGGAAKPKDIGALINEGVRLQQAGKWEQARASFNAALALKPSSADARYNLAVLALEELEDHQGAAAGSHGSDAFIAGVRAAVDELKAIISADTSGRGETSGLAHRTIGKTLMEYLSELATGKQAQDELLRQAEEHLDKARSILQNSADLDSVILEYAALKKTQFSVFLSSTVDPPAAAVGVTAGLTVGSTVVAGSGTGTKQAGGSSSGGGGVARSNATLNRALDLLQAVSRSVDEALQTPYSSGIDLDCLRLHAEALEEFWDWYLVPSSIEHYERIMGASEVERVSRAALDCSCRVALALPEMTADDDSEFLAHRGDLYQAILRWHRSLRVRAAAVAAGAGSGASGGGAGGSPSHRASPGYGPAAIASLLSSGGSCGISGGISSSSSGSSSGGSCSSSSCGSSSIESLCSSLLRARLEAVLTRNASTARGMVDLADALAFLVSEAVYLPELLAAFSPPSPSGGEGGSLAVSAGTGAGTAAGGSGDGGSGGGSGSGGSSSSSSSRKKELMASAHGCILVALQLLNTMSKTVAAARENAAYGVAVAAAAVSAAAASAAAASAAAAASPAGAVTNGGAGGASGLAGALAKLGEGGGSALAAAPTLSFATTPDTPTLLLKIARRCYETAIALWKGGQMSRDEYLDFGA